MREGGEGGRRKLEVLHAGGEGGRRRLEKMAVGERAGAGCVHDTRSAPIVQRLCPQQPRCSFLLV
eukprot:73180-Chlamydomonas_euryale.AAC.1